MRDRRESLKKGTCINVGGGEYIVDECISSGGGQALIYRCHLKEHESAQRYVLKEYYPPEAVRENGAIVEGPGWKFRKRHSLEYYYQKAKKAEAYAALFRQKSHQAQFVSEVIPDEHSMVSLMRMASDDCKTIKQKLEEWYSSNLLGLAQHSDLYRVQESVKIIKGVLVALDMLHGKSCGNIVHRDLTPGNILIAESRIGVNTEYTIYPIDFSCAAPIGSPFDKEMSVSPGYTHPVLHENSHLLDLYSVAALLLVLVTGKECLHRVDNWEVNNLIVENNFYIGEALTTLDIPLGVRSKLGSVLKRAVSMNAGDRYSSAKEMYTELETLQEIIDGRGIHPEVLFDASAKEFKEQCENKTGLFCYEIKPDLVTEAIDYESEQPKKLLEQNTILLGGGGAGKTTKIRILWENCLDNWIADQENNPIPVFVPLSTFDSSEDGKNYIKDYIAKRYFPNLSETDSARRAALMGMFRSQERYILILDGINESAGNDKLNAEVAEFATIERVTVLITSRNNLCDGWDDVKKLFHVAKLKPLDDELIIKKVYEAGRRSPSRKLLETLRRPMFLTMYLQLEITEKKVETPGQILYEHHKHLANAYKTGHHGRDIEARFEFILGYILPRLATTINKLAFNYNELYDVAELIYADAVAVNRRFKKLKSNDMDIGDIVGDVLHECGILRNISAENDYMPDNYVFVHQNYLEFYQALDIYNQMTAFKGGRELPKILTAGILPDTVMQFLGDLCGEHEFRTKTDCSENLSPVEKWMQNFCVGRNDRAAQLAVRNLIEVMKWSRDRCVTANYSNLDLSLVNFYDCQVANSSFEGATVAATTFIRFGHRKPVDTLAMVYSQEERLVTGCWGEKGICFWDLTTGQVVKKIDHYDTISTFDISADEQLVMVRSLGEVAVYKIADGEKVNELKLYSLNASIAQKDRHALVGFCRDNRTILCSCGPEGEEEIRLWDVYTGESKPVIELNKGYLKKPEARTQCCALSADRSTLYAVSECGELAVWSLTDEFQCRKRFQTHSKVICLAVTPDKKHVALLTDQKVLLILCLATGAIETVCDSMETDVITATNFHLIWAGNRQLCGYAFGNKEKLAFNTPPITAIFADSTGEKLFFADAYGRIRIGDIREKRIIASFVCSTYVDWSEPHSIMPHIYDNGIARVVHDRQIQCIQKERSYVIRSRNYCNCFDGNYHICQEPGSEESDHLVVRDLRTGAVISSVADDLRCVAYDADGGELFDTRSDFRWAKYCAAEQRLVVNYWAGLVKILNLRTGKWTAVGDWSSEVAHILTHCDEEDWDAMRAELMNISDRCFFIDSYVVFGTYDGRIQFWNLEGTKIADISAHNTSIERMYAVPGGNYFVSEGVDGSRCIWNATTFEKTCCEAKGSLINQGNIFKVLTVDEARCGGFDPDKSLLEDSCVTDEDLIVHCEVVGNLVLYACEEKEKLPANRLVSDSGNLVVYYVEPDPENYEASYNSFVCVYDTETKKRLRSYELLVARTQALDDNDIHFTNYAVNLCLHEKEQLLAVAFADGSVILYNLLQDSLWPCYYWNVIDAENISNCIFTDVELSSMLKKRLWQNGAKI